MSSDIRLKQLMFIDLLHNKDYIKKIMPSDYNDERKIKSGYFHQRYNGQAVFYT
jgi:hypothetical protein